MVLEQKYALESLKVSLICIIWQITFKKTAWLHSTLVTHQGPVVQSVVSLTSSLRVISLTVLVDSIYKILIFFAEKM